MWRSHIRILTTTLCVNPTAPTLVSKIKRPRSNQNFISISILLNQYFCNLCQTGRIMNQSRCMQVDSDTTSSYRKLQLIWIEPQSINQIYLSSTKNQFCGKCSGMKNYYSQTKRETKFTLKKRRNQNGLHSRRSTTRYRSTENAFIRVEINFDSRNSSTVQYLPRFHLRYHRRYRFPHVI